MRNKKNSNKMLLLFGSVVIKGKTIRFNVFYDLGKWQTSIRNKKERTDEEQVFLKEARTLEKKKKQIIKILEE